MDLRDQVPVFLGHVEAHAWPGDAGVVHQDVETPEVVERGGDQPAPGLPLGDVTGVGDRVTARGPDLLGHDLRGSASPPSPTSEPPKSLTTTPRALGREAVRLGPPDAPSAAGDDGHFAVECSHQAAEK